MTKLIFLVEQDLIIGGFTARALGESIFTEADSLDDLREKIKDAVHCHLPDKQAELEGWRETALQTVCDLFPGEKAAIVVVNVL